MKTILIILGVLLVLIIIPLTVAMFVFETRRVKELEKLLEVEIKKFEREENTSQ